MVILAACWCSRSFLLDLCGVILAWDQSGTHRARSNRTIRKGEKFRSETLGLVDGRTQGAGALDLCFRRSSLVRVVVCHLVGCRVLWFIHHRRKSPPLVLTVM